MYLVVYGANLDPLCSSESILLGSETLALWYANLCLVVLGELLRLRSAQIDPCFLSENVWRALEQRL
jgi:hypothetical protein